MHLYAHIGNVGKTSLLRSLVRYTTKAKPKEEGPNVATDGIDITEVWREREREREGELGWIGRDKR